MRALAILLLTALTLGAAGGYAWWAMTAPAAKVAGLPKAKSIALPASPEERPAALDEEWAARAQNEESPTAPAAARASSQEPQTNAPADPPAASDTDPH
jgi:hypothetical protein